jgi:hypothetical protein
MKELGYIIELIIDRQVNLLSYARALMRVNRDIAFRQFVKEIYELKSTVENDKERKLFKNPLNVI